MTKKFEDYSRTRTFGRTDRRDIPLENDAMFSTVMQYEALRRSYVIFVCMFDLFERGRTKYTFKSICEEDRDLPLGDGRCIMFLNTKGSVGDLGNDMDAFFEYLNGGVSSIGTGKDSGSEFVEMVDNYVLDINGDEDWRQGYMKYELNLIEKYKDGRADGINEGVSIGRAEGEANERSRMAKSLKEQGVPIEVIAKAASISIEETKSILNS